jgi:hypothetical protein
MESHQGESESEAVQRGYKKSRRLKGSFLKNLWAIKAGREN